MALQAEPYINMLLRSVQHMGHSDALKKFDLTLIFNLFLQHFFSKELYWLKKNCFGKFTFK